MEYTICKLSVMKNCYWLANQNPTQVNPLTLFELFYTQSCFFFLAFTSFLIFGKYWKNRCWYVRFPILRMRVLEPFKILLLVNRYKLVTQNRRESHQRNAYGSVRIYAICVYLSKDSAHAWTCVWLRIWMKIPVERVTYIYVDPSRGWFTWR